MQATKERVGELPTKERLLGRLVGENPGNEVDYRVTLLTLN